MTKEQKVRLVLRIQLESILLRFKIARCPLFCDNSGEAVEEAGAAIAHRLSAGNGRTLGTFSEATPSLTSILLNVRR